MTTHEIDYTAAIPKAFLNFLKDYHPSTYTEKGDYELRTAVREAAQIVLTKAQKDRDMIPSRDFIHRVMEERTALVAKDHPEATFDTEPRFYILGAERILLEHYGYEFK